MCQKRVVELTVLVNTDDDPDVVLSKIEGVLDEEDAYCKIAGIYPSWRTFAIERLD